MSKLSLESLSLENIKIDIKEKNDKLILSFIGALDLKAPEEKVEAFFNKVHQYIVEKECKKCILNIEELSFINSSSIKSLINWIKLITQLELENLYVLEFKLNKDEVWQKKSLTVLQMMAKNIIILK